MMSRRYQPRFCFPGSMILLVVLICLLPSLVDTLAPPSFVEPLSRSRSSVRIWRPRDRVNSPSCRALSSSRRRRWAVGSSSSGGVALYSSKSLDDDEKDPTATTTTPAPADTTRRVGSESKKETKKKKGYQFGDISKSITRKFTSSVQDLTGKEDYEFGDLSRWVDSRVKDKVNAVTGKDTYEFGDLSRWADSKAKAKAMEFTNKTDYTPGDISKEILRKVKSGDYTTEDILLLCRILVTMGVTFSPVAASLPGKLLVEMLDVSLAQELGGRFVGAITLELDRRMKKAVTGDSSYELGDLTKKAFLKFIDKDEYAFGDITKTVLERIDDDADDTSENASSKPKTFAESAKAKESTPKPKSQSEEHEQELVDVLDLDPKILEELLEWDKALMKEEEVNDKKS